MKKMTIRGYTDRPSVAPGETVGFHVDADAPGPFSSELVRVVRGVVDPSRPTDVYESVPARLDGEHFAGAYRTNRGGHVRVDAPVQWDESGFTVHVFLFPTRPTAPTAQGIIGQQRDDAREGWLLSINDGRLRFSVGDGTTTVRLNASKPLLPEVWYSVVASYDAASGRIALHQTARVNRVNSRFGLVVSLDSDCSDSELSGVALSRSGAPLIIAGMWNPGLADGVDVDRCLDGKLDAPKLVRGAATDPVRRALDTGNLPPPPSVLAYWDFAANGTSRGFLTDDVLDVSAAGSHGRCVNSPDRGMTGWNWAGHTEHYAHARNEYGAIWFHSDSLEDCRWPQALSWTVPPDARSGVYALRVTKDGRSDHIVFFVRPAREAVAPPVAVLIPTFSYIMYGLVNAPAEAACETAWAHSTVLHPSDIELTRKSPAWGTSSYEYHSDGRGCQYASWRRPLLNIRPDYTYGYGRTWNFSTDLHIIGWLEAKGFDYDVITDHDIHAEGADLMRRYNVVISGTHPEYASARMLDAWEDYVAGGGRGMYLGGNGWYWVTAQHPSKPHLLEIRRGESGDQTWKARPGEYHLGFTGERGGLWRNRGRAPQKIFGTGFTAHGMSVSAPFHALPDAKDPRAAWIFSGVDFADTFGARGLIDDGAAGQEFDRYDISLGTPPHAMLLASSHGHTVYDSLVPEDLFATGPHVNGEEHPLVRADLVYYTNASGGGMFAASSMTWAGCLPVDGYDNDVSTITANVLRRFAAAEPLPEIDQVAGEQASTSNDRPIGRWV